MIQRAESERKMRAIKQANIQLSQMWERIQQAHDSTTVATGLRDAGLQNEFWLQALADLTEVHAIVTEGRKTLAGFLVGELNVSSRTVAGVADTSPSTILTWTKESHPEEA